MICSPDCKAQHAHRDKGADFMTGSNLQCLFVHHGTAGEKQEFIGYCVSHFATIEAFRVHNKYEFEDFELLSAA